MDDARAEHRTVLQFIQHLRPASEARRHKRWSVRTERLPSGALTIFFYVSMYNNIKYICKICCILIQK
jgi:hypothetical protein